MIQTSVAVDTTPLAEATGVMLGVLNGVESEIYVDNFINYMAEELRKEFYTKFFAVALANPKSYHHVFEWGSIGFHGDLQEEGGNVPRPLFSLTKRGQGRTKTVSFKFNQSIMNVPLPDAQKTGIPQENIDRLKRRSIFRFKAFVMESGMSVHVTPKRAKALFVPSPGAPNGKNFVFSQGHTVNNPGGTDTTGKFTAFWELFWNNYAQAYSDEFIVPKAEKTIKEIADQNLRTIRSGTSKSLKYGTVGAGSASMSLARTKAIMAQKQIEASAKAEYAAEEEDWDSDEW